MSQEQMFCYHCEQTAKGQACTIFGVCGKTPQVSALIDLQIYALTGLSQITLQAKTLGIETEEVDIFTCKALFSTLTNVNFDQKRYEEALRKSVKYRESLKKKITQKTTIWKENGDCLRTCSFTFPMFIE